MVLLVWPRSQEPYLIAKLDSAERTYKELSVSTSIDLRKFHLHSLVAYLFFLVG